ncbi:MAG: DUF2807 domain-containing protein [Candidatus Riflebacteria bacterium]|nr:DUF2807 domain-containing protein [Candidatus Riflebacteria bacterium]
MIEAGGAYDITVTCKKEQSFEISGDDNVLPLIQTEVKDGRLSIQSKESMSPSRSIKISIDVADVRRLTLSGASKVSISGVKNDSLAVSASGAVELTASGETKTLTLDLSGTGRIGVGDLHAQTARVTTSGAGSVDVYATESLSVQISGVGSVTYSGNPKNIQKNISGIGSLRQR